MLLSAINVLAQTQGLGDEAQIKLARYIYRYALKLNIARDLKDIAAELHIVRPLIDFKKSHLDNTHYVLSRLWRAVYSYYCDKQDCNVCTGCGVCTSCSEDAKKKPCSLFRWDFDQLASKYCITTQDLEYVVHSPIVVDSDLDKILGWSTILDTAPDTNLIADIVSKISPHIHKIVHRKLAFIASYNNMELHDFVAEVTIAVIQALTANDYIHCRVKLEAIAGQVTKNTVCNIITKYTAFKRSRLIPIDDGYRVTTLSLDSEYEGNSNSNTLHSLVGNPSRDAPEDSIHIAHLLERIRSGIDSEEQHFIDIGCAVLSNGNSCSSALNRVGWSHARFKRFREKVKTLMHNNQTTKEFAESPLLS